MRQKLKATPVMMILFKDVELLEHDAQSQYLFHKRLAFSFFIGMLVVPFIPELYQHGIGTFTIEELMLWTLVATHFTGMSAALAAKNNSGSITEVQEGVSNAEVVAG